jgi:hypothetical protein
MKTRISVALAVVVVGIVTVVACGSDDDDSPPPPSGNGGSGGSGSPEETGSVCTAATECFTKLDGGTLKGDALCLDRVRGGYCTHLCDSDSDCCAVDGECKTKLKQVCSPFESTDQKMCFLSCEDGDLMSPDGGAAPADEQAFCQQQANSAFICRSSGGGSENRKLCVPGTCGVGAACGADGDCASGLTCITALRGGYCGKADCTATADCPTGSACIKHSDGKNYCFGTCVADSDCSFCRSSTAAGTCSDKATFVDSGATGRVCVPPT